jgi:SpoVK/Ycf46/Vps4 family AAA+-type ATPase
MTGYPSIVNERLLGSLRAAVEAAPNDLVLRLHLAELLVASGAGPEAIGHLAAVLAADPSSVDGQQLMAQALGGDAPGPTTAAPSARETPTVAADPGSFDWASAEAELDELAPVHVEASADERAAAAAFPTETSPVTLADVGGLQEVKDRLFASFLAPMANPELRKLYGKSLRGGLLLFGPPGCGKTYLAKAVAGELGAAFLHISLSDVLDMYVGQSERNLHEIFESARASVPCVLFIDELDALGQKRSLTRNSGMRTTVNQLLTELDGVGTDNEGVFVLAATNHPWDVDPALRRPGRFDRTLLVLPPDPEARAAIFTTHLRDRPVSGIDVRELVKKTDGFSGADIAHLCESAAEAALLDSARTGVARPIAMADFRAALGTVRPSIGPWMDTARNVVLYANNGEYDELGKYLRKYGRR